MQKNQHQTVLIFFIIIPECSDDLTDFFGHALNNTSHKRSE